MVLKVTEVAAGIAAVVFVFTPVSTALQVLLFAAAIIVFVICVVINRKLKRENVGYWPDKPDFWNR